MSNHNHSDRHDYRNLMNELGEDSLSSNNSSSPHSSHTNSWAWKDFLIHFILLLVCIAPAGSILKGTMPLNLFTVILAIVGGIAGIWILCIIIDMS